MYLPQLLSEYNKAKIEYELFVENVKVAFSEEDKQTFLSDPSSICYKYAGKSREECLLEQWNDEKRRVYESLERKEDRMNKANYRYMLEKTFQDEHARIDTVFDEKTLFGYYKVFRRPTHYEFVLKRSTHVLGDEIPHMVIVPLSVVMGEREWHDVSPSKICVE